MSLQVQDVDWGYVFEELSKPFPVETVKFKVQATPKSTPNKAIAVAFIDARIVADRLNQVVGPQNWSDKYESLEWKEGDKMMGGVKCSLTVLGVTKEDIGTSSMADEEKGAVSDALKRAAVKFGIFRYSYDLGTFFVDYDPVKKKILKNPTLPVHAQPPKQGADPDALIMQLISENLSILNDNKFVGTPQFDEFTQIIKTYSAKLSLVEKRQIYGKLNKLREQLKAV